jgi:hypothetical protein
VFCARLVVFGYNQFPGVDINRICAPVINHVSFRVLLIAKHDLGTSTTVIDIEAAFLHGELSKEICMGVSEGLSVK